MHSDQETEYRTVVRALSDRIVRAQRPIRILDAVKWSDATRAEFFASDCSRQPEVDSSYYESRPSVPDAVGLRGELETLSRDIETQLGSQDPAGRMMERMCREYLLVLDLLDARGKAGFHDLSVQLFGRAAEPFHTGGPSLVHLAELLDESLRNLDEGAFEEDEIATITAPEAVVLLQRNLDEFFADSSVPVSVRLDDGIVADAAAGSDYIKLRADALFRPRELRLLEVHEGHVHVGTTLNGMAQPVCTFLAKGTPSTTITQEGLALFVEVVSFSSYPRRLRRVTDRIRAIHWAEQGATFLDVFRSLCSEGRTREEAYPTCVRVFRGSTPTAGPFTKDLAYSRGFVEVYNFIRLAVRRGRLDRVQLLFSGKVTLADMGDLGLLQERGIIEPARFLPPALADPSALSAWMAYANFLHRLDLEILDEEIGDLIG